MRQFKIYILVLTLLTTISYSCSDFDEINISPTAVGPDKVQVEYFINNSIIKAQQNPHIAERMFILNWKGCAHYERGYYAITGGDINGWSEDYWKDYVGSWINLAQQAINIGNEQIESGTGYSYTNNLVQIARIWKAYLISEVSDNFGPNPAINAFQGENPDSYSLEDTYHYILDELEDAVGKLDEGVDMSPVTEFDYMLGFDVVLWKKYANSLRLRFAMRLSEADNGYAQTKFEKAVADAGGIAGFVMSLDEMPTVPEDGGWNDLTRVMSRPWNRQYMTATMSNITFGLGGVESRNLLSVDGVALSNLDEAVFDDHVKSVQSYLGLYMPENIATAVNDPAKGHFFDGIPDKLDPRIWKMFGLVGYDDGTVMFRYDDTGDAYDIKAWDEKEPADTVRLNSRYSFNSWTNGDHGEKSSRTDKLYWSYNQPCKSKVYHDGPTERVWFGSWETYFLLAEAASYGWNALGSAKQHYEEGVAQSFDYHGLSQFASEYVLSAEYNRVGTSVSFDHTDEAVDYTINNYDPYTETAGTTTYEYPTNFGLPTNNDVLTKIITQKWIANCPWVPMEAWNDHRRLGLPFFVNPAAERLLPDMPNANETTILESRKEFFPQRLRYPVSLQNTNPDSYNQALQFLGGEDDVLTPLWWSKK
ncbi:SusD/RagB family nutrient-binding outer membrane lipoprotein [Carboxylicivirga marina]|uniref:SusD/RagB family nutrient-binding outer membrane lipoprotein n=1 Tax=Carboxylicivirga marina TaxID=2800988 RepID=A0ABS1HFX7_9BACT|nr:SusD/RagB family nutrient-binding outer membrane lipoprotein [Carboxylicivirga marina]MBK3516390.1 SusD/RagB family nutrient-binding outer membrane lipoprotein [Carboxylicivirga marina]